MQTTSKSMQQIPRRNFGRLLGAVLAVLTVVLAFGFSPALAGTALSATITVEPTPQAKEILLKMAEFLAKAPHFSVTIRSGYDAIQMDGQVIEFGEKRQILLQRPNRMRIESERSDGERGLVLFDGKEITAYKADDNVYAWVEKPGKVDDALVYLVRDLQFTLPMARMLHSEFPRQMESKITEISYVEENTLFDVVTDHLAARSDDVDMQMWVAQGEEPLPRRIILTYKKAPGQPQFRADFFAWDLSPKISADNFTFTPPAGAEQIPLLVPVRQKGSLPMQKGGE